MLPIVQCLSLQTLKTVLPIMRKPAVDVATMLTNDSYFTWYSLPLTYIHYTVCLFAYIMKKV